MDTTRMPADELTLDAPPALPRHTSANLVSRLLPVALVLVMGGMVAVYVTSGAAAARGPAFLFFPVMMVMSALGTVAYTVTSGGRAAELHRDRCVYLRYLDGIDAAAASTAEAQWQQLHAAHPAPDTLWSVTGSVRADGDEFGDVRIGIGSRPPAVRLVGPPPLAQQDSDPVTTCALQDVLRRHREVDGLPVTVELVAAQRITVLGDADAARALVRAVICRLAVAHSPHRLRIAAVLDASTSPLWDWLKWLAHHRFTDPAGRVVTLTCRTVDDVPPAPPHVHTLLVVDAHVDAESLVARAAVTVMAIGSEGASDPADVRWEIGPDGIRHDGRWVRPDQMSLRQAVTCARQLARYPDIEPPAEPDWLRLIGLSELPRSWSHRAPADFLRVPVGWCPDGTPLHLDLKEAAHNGMGPHGLCVGATGSGKSEFLRTLVLGLIATHPPEELNLVLVDFKGGATFLGLHRIRHVSALITNLAEEAAMVTRMADALAGEMTRRQELLRAAGDLANIGEYRRRSDLPSLPALLIVVDEFSELLQQHPDFAELFVAIGRVGRSLGMHLLLASQRLDEGRLRGLESHLSYRICLKTFSPGESRAVLGIADAHQLPNTPGAAYLKTPTGDIVRFQTAFVSEAVPAPAPPPRAESPSVFTTRWLVPDAAPEQPDSPSLLHQVVERLSGIGTPAHQVWLPPLPAAVALSDVLLSGGPPLSVAIGLVDRPFEQRRDRLAVSLDGAAGHVVIVGGPQAGKSTTAMTLAVALAATHHPRDVQLYVLDFGGGGLAGLQYLPHVGAVAGRTDVDLVRRTVADLHALITQREMCVSERGIGSMAEYRAARARGEVHDPYGDVFLVVDGWSTVRGEFEALEWSITTLAVQGLSLGVHVVVTASRWAELRPALKDQLGTRIELRLGDPAESEMDRRRARHLRPGEPGRGLSRDGRDLLVALPRLDGVASREAIGSAVARVGDTLRAQYGAVCAPPVRLLPTQVALSDLGQVARDRPATQALLGLGERDLEGVLLDFAEQPDLVVLGEPGCGKSTVLRTVCRDLVSHNRPDQVQLYLVDFRRALLGAVETDHLVGYAISPEAVQAGLPAMLDTLRSRLPGPHVTQRQLRDRSWWSGPEIYVVIDDYDLVSGVSVNPLAPLLPYLPHARDLGLHVLLARRSGGAARAMFDPLPAALKDLGCMGLMMSAGADDGVLLGSVRPVRLPPGRGTLVTRSAPDQLVQVAVAADESPR